MNRDLCSMLCGSLDGRGVWGRMDTCVCLAETLCCPAETITTLLTSYKPIQNKKFFKIKFKKKNMLMISLTSQAPTSPPIHVKKLCCSYVLVEHLRL